MTIASLNAMIANATKATIKLEGAGFPIKSVAEAAKLFTDYRDAEGDWKWEESQSASTMRKTDGYIYVGSKVVAHFSYNGRLWEGKESILGAVEIV